MAAGLLGLHSSDCPAQSIIVDPLNSHDVNFTAGSGSIYHIGDNREMVWSEDVVIEDAQWVRLRFDQIVLAGSPLGGGSSTLKITSLKDGKYQLLNSENGASMAELKRLL